MERYRNSWKEQYSDGTMKWESEQAPSLLLISTLRVTREGFYGNDARHICLHISQVNKSCRPSQATILTSDKITTAMSQIFSANVEHTTAHSQRNRGIWKLAHANAYERICPRQDRAFSEIMPDPNSGQILLRTQMRTLNYEHSNVRSAPVCP